MGQDFMRFKFKTNDNLVYNQKINNPVCGISLSGVVQKGDIYCPQFKLQDCFYEIDILVIKFSLDKKMILRLRSESL